MWYSEAFSFGHGFCEEVEIQVELKIEVTVALKSVLYGPVGTAGDCTTTVKE